MPVTPLVPAIPPLFAALAADASLALTLGLARVVLFPAHDLGTRLAGAVHLALALGTLIVARATARYTRLLVARGAALSLVASASTLLLGVEVTSTLDIAWGGVTRECVHGALLALAAGYAWVTSPARAPRRSESPTSPA